MNCGVDPDVDLPMARLLKFVPAVVVVFVILPLTLVSQPAKPMTPRDLIEKAIALKESGKILPRYTYFLLSLTQNRNQKGKLFLDDTTLYEETWIGDLPYARVVEVKGKPLKGKALADEQARYDKAVAYHAGLIAIPAKIQHPHHVDSSLRLESLLTAAYALSELRQETLAGELTHVIDCIPLSSADSSLPAATRHATLWITDSGIILRDVYEVVSDETDKLHGSHGQQDFQIIDGNQLPLHAVFHLNAPNGNTGDFESTYSRFRRFNVSSRIVSGDESPADTSNSNSPQK